jgi:hypothetical protein
MHDMAEIWRQFSPQALDLDIAFRRPIFWDDCLTIMVDNEDDTWKAICLAKGEKVGHGSENQSHGQRLRAASTYRKSRARRSFALVISCASPLAERPKVRRAEDDPRTPFWG